MADTCTIRGCPNPVLAMHGLMGGMVLCRQHVMAYYPGVATLEEAQRVHARNMANALGYGEDCDDDVRRNLREWQPQPTEDAAIIRAYIQES